MKTITATHYYDVTPARVWAMATDFDALQTVMKGIVKFKGLPEGRTFTGQKIHLDVSLFGVMPWQPYHMEFLECDDAAMVFRSSEAGAGVKTWRHTLQVSATQQGGAQLTDKIEIDAGCMTFAVAAWAKWMYSARHKPRLALLAAGKY